MYSVVESQLTLSVPLQPSEFHPNLNSISATTLTGVMPGDILILFRSYIPRKVCATPCVTQQSHIGATSTQDKETSEIQDYCTFPSAALHRST